MSGDSLNSSPPVDWNDSDAVKGTVACNYATQSFKMHAAFAQIPGLGTLSMLPPDIRRKILDYVIPEKDPGYTIWKGGPLMQQMIKNTSFEFFQYFWNLDTVPSAFVIEADVDSGCIRNLTAAADFPLFPSHYETAFPDPLGSENLLADMPWAQFSEIRVKILAPRKKSAASLKRLHKLLLKDFRMVFNALVTRRPILWPPLVIEVVDSPDRTWITGPNAECQFPRLSCDSELMITPQNRVQRCPSAYDILLGDHFTDLEVALSVLLRGTTFFDRIIVELPKNIREVLDFGKQKLVVGGFDDKCRSDSDYIVVPSEVHRLCYLAEKEKRFMSRRFLALHDGTCSLDALATPLNELLRAENTTWSASLPGIPEGGGAEELLTRRDLECKWLSMIPSVLECIIDEDDSPEGEQARIERAFQYDILCDWVIQDGFEMRGITKPVRESPELWAESTFLASVRAYDEVARTLFDQAWLGYCQEDSYQLSDHPDDWEINQNESLQRRWRAFADCRRGFSYFSYPTVEDRDTIWTNSKIRDVVSKVLGQNRSDTEAAA